MVMDVYQLAVFWPDGKTLPVVFDHHPKTPT
jgi:hypothetical protein